MYIHISNCKDELDKYHLKGFWSLICISCSTCERCLSYCIVTFLREISGRIISRNQWPSFRKDLGLDNKEEEREELKVMSNVVRLNWAIGSL